MTEAAREGVEERLLKRHGNWESDDVRVYINDSPQRRLAVSEALLRDDSTAQQAEYFPTSTDRRVKLAD